MIEQIGIGVSNIEKSKTIYKQLGFYITFTEVEGYAYEGMNIYTKNNKLLKRKSTILGGKNNFGHIELIQPLEKIRFPEKNIKYGDIGIYKIKVKTSKNINNLLNIEGVNILDKENNIIQDPDKNIIEISSDRSTKGSEVYGFTIGVSDYKKTISFYENLGFKMENIETSESGFKDTQIFEGGDRNITRVTMKKNKTLIEIVQVNNEKVSNIFSNRFWGDIGYVHIGFQYEQEYFNKNNMIKTVDSGNNFWMGNINAMFCYAEDPDKILVEFTKVYYYKLLGINLNIEKIKNLTLNILNIKSMFVKK